MIELVFVEPSGHRHEITATDGESVMQAATVEGFSGIDAECGGSPCMCATCHCLVIEAPTAQPELQSNEADTLRFTAEDMQDNSRLIYQVPASPELDGTVFQAVGG